MLKLNEVTAIVYDSSGLYTNIAIKLAKTYKRVFYYHNWSHDYPTPKHTEVGKGFDTIEHTLYPFDHYDEIDLWIFPSLFDSDLQVFLEKQGKLVWGAREGEVMEINRWDFIEYQKKIGMAVSPSKLVKGITELRKELYTGDDGRFVKIDANNRGEMETFKYINEEISEICDIRPLEHSLGMKSELMNFIVQDKIDCKCETGYDGFTIDGEFPSTALFGIEVKDMGYIGGVRPYKKLPDSVTQINEEIAPALKEYGYRGNISTEVREGVDGKNYLIDLTCRQPYPPTNSMLVIWDNMAECMFEGAQGNLVDMEFNDYFVCEVMMFSDSAKTDYFTLFYPDKYKDNIFQPYITFMNGRQWVIPQDISKTNVGSIVANGVTLEGAVNKFKEIEDEITGHHLKIDFACLDSAIKQFKDL